MASPFIWQADLLFDWSGGGGGEYEIWLLCLATHNFKWVKNTHITNSRG